MYNRDRRPTVVINNVTSGGGIGFIGVMTMTFIVMKLVGLIAWSWWWVLAPAWIAVLIWILIVAIILASAIWSESVGHRWK